ncbi:hypothetical protein KIPB_010207, partial [Kipferlia bialata]
PAADCPTCGRDPMYPLIVESTTNDCYYDKYTRRCEGGNHGGGGSCSYDPSGIPETFCVEYRPGVCGCSECAFDVRMESCVGRSTYPEQCLLQTNGTCAIANCGYQDTNLDYCMGICPGSTCRQLKENGRCQCSTLKCAYDYAEQKCSGACEHNHADCLEILPGKCACTGCAYDFGTHKCQGGCEYDDMFPKTCKQTGVTECKCVNH